MKPQKIHKVQKLKMLPIAHCVILVSTSAVGMYRVISLPSFSEKYHCKTENGIMDVLSVLPFYVLIANSLKEILRLPKLESADIASSPPPSILHSKVDT